MKLHRNARTCLHTRLLLVRRVEEEGWTLAQAAEAAGVSVRTVSKYLRRYRQEGEEGLLDHASAPHTVANRTPEDRIQVIAALRRLHMTGAEIAELLAMPLSTVSAVLSRIGLGRLARLEPREPANRYEKSRAGELVHVDVKKLGRIARPGHRVTGRSSGSGHHRRAFELGWEFVHVAIDDATRLAYAEVLADEKGATAVGFLRRAVAFFASFGIEVERVMTDNGPAYRSLVHALACKALGLKHSRTRPYRPRTNGKAERFIRTLLGGWAYGAIYGSSEERTRALAGWLEFYNLRRRHGSLGRQPPVKRLQALRNNVAGSYI
ncbi:MAG: IS481 family transposase [Gaiellaceae bacterium]